MASGRRCNWSGELERWRRVLEDAVILARGDGSAKPHERQAARRWLDGPSARRGGFCWVCQQLDLDSKAVRRAIQQPERRAA